LKGLFAWSSFFGFFFFSFFFSFFFFVYSFLLYILCEGHSKVFRFGKGTTVAEACQEIKERLNGMGGDHFGLYQSKTKAATKQHARSRWLKMDVALGTCSLENGDELEYRSTNRPVKVAMPDGSTKMVNIDDSAVVEKIIDQMGYKLGLANAEEYGMSVMINGKDTWLQPRFTLQEQPQLIRPDAQLNFRKRFFVDDANVDPSDRTQLGFIYTQSVGRVLDGTYPCKSEEAVMFAAIQLQVQSGNYSPGNHNSSWVKKQNVLPKQYTNKDLEGAVLKQWGKLVNTNEQNAKFKYVSTVRSLPTFGITIWRVREQVPKKRKLQEVLLGLTRDAVIRMDPNNQTILSTFPLKHVRRWAAGTNSFTLDYGQYKNEYYTVQVGGAEAEDISNTLAGYIDILLKRQREGRLHIEVDEGELAKKEELGPVCAVPNMSNIVMQGVGKYSPEDFRSLDLLPGLNMLSKGKAQPMPGQMVISDWGDAARRINQLTNDTPQEFDEDDNDPSPVELKWNLLGQAANIGGSVSDVLHNAPTTNAQKITDQLAELLKAAHKAANATSDISLLDAAKKVSTAVADVLRTAHDLENDPESIPLKHRLAKAADALKGTSALMARAADAELVDTPSTQLILESAEQAAQALKAFCDVAGEKTELRDAFPDIQALLAQSRAYAANGEGTDNINLLEAARKVAGEVEKVLSTSRNDQKMDEVAPDLQALLAAAKAFANSPDLEENINLLEAVNKVSHNVKGLLATSRKVDEAMAMADKLVEKAKNLAPLLMDAAALDQFRLEADAVKQAAKEAFFEAKKMITDPVEQQRLMEKAKATNSALVQMLNAAEVAVARNAKDQEEVQTAVAQVITPLEAIKFSGGDSKKVTAAAEQTKNSIPALLLAVKHQALAEPQRAEELLAEAKSVTKSVAELGKRVRAMETAEEEDRQRDEPRVVPEEARAIMPDIEALLTQAKALSRGGSDDGSLSLLDAVRSVNNKVKHLLATSHVDDDPALVGRLEMLDTELEEMAEMDHVEDQREALPGLLVATVAVADSIQGPWQAVLRAAQDVADATKGLLTDQQEKFALFNIVRGKAKQAVASTLALANVSTAVEDEVTNAEAKAELHAQTVAVHDVARRLVKELANASKNPDNWEAQATLVSTARELAKPFANMVNSARECIPAVDSVASKQTIRFATQEAGNAIVELVNACRAAGTVTGAQDVDEANQALAVQQAELDNAMSGQVSKTMSAEEARAAVERELQNVMTSAGALSNVGASKDVGPAARNATDAMGGLVDACKALDAASGTTDAMEGARELLPDLAALISASKANATGSGKDVEVSLLEAVSRVNSNVKTILTSTQGTEEGGSASSEESHNQAREQAVRVVQDSLNDLKPSRTKQSGDLVALSTDLEKRTGVLAQATNRVCQLAGDPNCKADELDAAIASAAAAFPALVTAVNKIASSAKSSEARQGMVASTQLLGGQVAKVLANAGAARVDPHARKEVEEGYAGGMAAGRDLLQATRSAMPGLQDLEKALHLLDACLDEANLASSEGGDKDVRTLPASTDRLGDAAVGVIRAARVEPDELGAQSVSLARCLSDILDVTRAFCPVASTLACALPVKQLLVSLDVASGKEIEVITKKIVALVPAVMEAAKQATLDNPDDAAEIKSCAKVVKPSLTKLVGAAKSAKGGDRDGLHEAAANFGETLSELMGSIPGGGSQVSRLMSGAAGLISPVQGMIQSARHIVETPGDEEQMEELTRQGKLLGAAVRFFRETTKSMTPGTVECELALKEISMSIEQLDEASMDAAVGILELVPQQSNQAAQEKMVNVAKTLASRIQTVVEAIKGSDFEKVAASAQDVSASVEQIKEAALQLASTTSNQDIQSHNLGMSKSVADATKLFMLALSELTVDRSSVKLKRDLAASATAIRDAIQVTMKSLKDGVVGLRACDEALKQVNNCRSLLEEKVSNKKKLNYGECQKDLVEQARSLVADGTALFHTAKTEPQSVGDPSKAVADAILRLTESSMQTAGAADDKSIQKMLVLSTQTVCNAVENLVSSSKRVATDPENHINVQGLSAAFEDLSNGVMSLIRSVQEGNTGERDCREASGQIRKVVSELDSCAVSAAAGTYKLESKQPLSEALRQAESLCQVVRDNANNVLSAMSEGQSALGLSSKALAQSFGSFANSSKLVSGICADITVQSDCLQGAKAIGSMAASLVMTAAVPRQGSKEKKLLKEKSASLDQQVEDFLTLLKEHVSAPAKGVAACLKAHAALKACKIEQKASGKKLNAILPPLRQILALFNDFFLGCRSTVGKDFVENVKGLAAQAEQFLDLFGIADIRDAALKKDCVSAAQALVTDVLSLLELLVMQRKDSDQYQDRLVALAESVPRRVERCLVAARKVPGAGDLDLVESKLEDVASEQMHAAAEEIQAAAEMLKNFEIADDAELDEDDLAGSVLVRARSITQATISLVRAAMEAQREINKKRAGFGDAKDGDWASGLMSAAKLVALTTQDLVAASSLVAKGELSEDAIIAIARTVGGATARLNAAAKARLDAGSVVQKHLAEASGKINTETKDLLKEAQLSMEENLRQEEQAKASISSARGAFAARAARLEEQEKVNALSRQLDNAYRSLKIARQKEYEETQRKVGSAGGAGKSTGAAKSSSLSVGKSKMSRRSSVRK
jgi:talin